MKIVIQRVAHSNVKVDNEIVGEIKQGLMLLIGIQEEDNEEDANWLVQKILNLRIFSNEEENSIVLFWI